MRNNSISKKTGLLLVLITLFASVQSVCALDLTRKSSFSQPGSVTAENAATTVPVTLRLGEVVANPYSDDGQAIQFTLSVPQDVSLKLFTPDGREVMTLFQGREDAGTFSIPLPSNTLRKGNYVCQLEGKGLDVKYLVLTKERFQGAKTQSGTL